MVAVWIAHHPFSSHHPGQLSSTVPDSSPNAAGRMERSQFSSTHTLTSHIPSLGPQGDSSNVSPWGGAGSTIPISAIGEISFPMAQRPTLPLDTGAYAQVGQTSFPHLCRHKVDEVGWTQFCSHTLGASSPAPPLYSTTLYCAAQSRCRTHSPECHSR